MSALVPYAGSPHARSWRAASTSTAVWSDERIERLKQLWKDGFSAGQISDELGGISRSAVIGKIHRLKLDARTGPTTRLPRGRRTYRNPPSVRYARAVAEPEAPRPFLTREKFVAEPQSKNLTLADLNAGMCKFSADDGPPWTFCAHDSLPGSSWCEFHKSICVQEVSPKEAQRRADRDAARTGSKVGHGKTFVE
jgi:GcrA cell cycle regulator